MLFGVYGLLDARDSYHDLSRIRYVGRGRLPKRPMEHGRPANLTKCAHFPVVRWIKKLRLAGSDYVFKYKE